MPANANVNPNVFYGRTTAGASATPVSATPKKCINGLVVKSLAANAAAIDVGASDVTVGGGFQLQPGDSVSIAINDPSNVYIIGNGSDVVSWIAN